MRRWNSAYNRRDFETMIDLTDPGLEFRSARQRIEDDQRCGDSHDQRSRDRRCYEEAASLHVRVPRPLAAVTLPERPHHHHGSHRSDDDDHDEHQQFERVRHRRAE